MYLEAITMIGLLTIVSAQQNPLNWTWISGSNTAGQRGIYGIKRIANSSNIPGARYKAASWIDSNNNFWLFGGYGYDTVGNYEGFLNDLWKYDGMNWTWISGSNYVNQYGTYVASSSNIPGGRKNAASWIDSSDNLWIFGGFGYDAANIYTGNLNDLWKFNGVNWTWISGSDSTNQIGNYGTKGIANSSNVPGARFSAVSWIDSDNNLWLFGGNGYDSVGGNGYLNDLWKFDGMNWTWISGSNYANQRGTYGTKGIASSSNIPGGSFGAISWIDSNNNLWIFGGGGYAASSHGSLNDLWKFNGTNWTWISGSNSANQYGTYGNKGIANSSNIPGGRGDAASWVDSNNNLWLFGGNGFANASTQGPLNDLWKFDGMNWIWISGSNLINQRGTYGTKGIASSLNIPGGRSDAASWKDSNNNLWLFGGTGYAATGSGMLNDLWKFDENSIATAPLTSSLITSGAITSNALSTSSITTNTGIAATTGRIPIIPIIVSINPISSNPVNPSNRIILQATSNKPSAKYKWIVIEGDLELNSNTLDLGPNGSILIIKQFILGFGKTVVLRVNASDSFTFNSKDYTIITTSAPIGGYLQVNNNIGNVYSTIFEFSTGNWTTNDENNNTFAFSYSSIDKNNNVKILSSFQRNPKLNYSFSESGNYTIVVTVQNRNRVKSNTSINVLVLDAQFNVNQVISSIQNSIDESISNENTEQTLQQIQLLNNLISTQNLTNSSLTIQNQRRFVSVIQTALNRTQNISQESGSLRLNTLNSVLNINIQSNSQLIDQTVEIIQSITNKINLQQGELIDSNIPRIVITTLNTIVQNSINSTNNNNPAKIISTIKALGSLQLENRIIGELPVVVNSQTINTVAVIISSDSNTTSKLTPNNLTTVILPQLLTTKRNKEEFKIQIIELEQDIVKSNFLTSLNASSNAVVIINSDKPINLQDSISISFTLNSEEQQPSFCGYRENITMDWRNDSTCQLEVIGNQSICNCNELGQVTVFTLSANSQPSLSSNKPKKETPLVEIVVPVIIVCVIIGIAFIVVISRRRRTLRDIEMKENSYLIIKEAEISEPIGSGNFGTVYKGIAFGGTAVALKHMEGATEDDLLAEIAILAKVHHPNCVRFLGIYNDSKKSYIITEFCEKGSLLSLIKKSSFSTKNLLAMAIEACKGMIYLEEMKIIHRDLAARNLLVDGDNIVKVADFGMSKVLSDKIYDKVEGVIAVRWSAPEVLQYMKFSSKSDVWSMGIVLYEIFSLGSRPYPELLNSDVVTALTEKQYRMEKPISCPSKIWEIAEDCWNSDPKSRPTFVEISARLRELQKLELFSSTSPSSPSPNSTIPVCLESRDFDSKQEYN